MKHLIFLLSLFISFVCSAQKLKVTSFKVQPDDLAARDQPRVDRDGQLGALLKICVVDKITKVEGTVLGDIVDNGVEKWVYVTDRTKKIRVHFEKHIPLMIVFDEYNYPSAQERMVYEVILEEENSASLPTTGTNSAPTPLTTTAQVVSPTVAQQNNAKPNTTVTMSQTSMNKSLDYKVGSFVVSPFDLTARVNPRIDLEGKSAAVLKIGVPDDIIEAQGNVLGDIIKKGLEKWVYIAEGSKYIKLIFENHYPITITFKDYGFPTLEEKMVYEIKLVEDEESMPTTISTPKQALAVTSHLPSTAEILAEAKRAYESKDYTKALKLFRKIDGDKESQYYIGEMFSSGYGVTKDYNEAVIWTEKAAMQGYVDAQVNLGVMYSRGNGVPQSDKEAVKWYRKAADQGNTAAQNNLGVCYENGLGVTKDIQEAVKWYRMSAEQGDVLGKFYLESLGY
ncbi:MAG: sel1 repeat family protein [Muribaculaceae bacterium]|nr:sel1 repeat family protein [Muribaculaceae bacterium]